MMQRTTARNDDSAHCRGSVWRRSTCSGSEASVPAALAQDAPSGRTVEVAATISFTEGPTVDADGAVYFTDLRGAGRILKMDPDGTVTTFREPSYRANGLIFDSDWRLLACEGGNGDDVLPRITRTNVETGEVEVLADHFEGQQLHQPNDLTIDGQGRIYFTDRPGANVTPATDRCPRRLSHRPRRLDRPHPDRAGGRTAQRPRRLPRRLDAVRDRDRPAGRRRAHDPRLRPRRETGRRATCASSTTSTPAGAATG